jgi:hypothetical protein
MVREKKNEGGNLVSWIMAVQTGDEVHRGQVPHLQSTYEVQSHSIKLDAQKSNHN